MTLAFTFRRAEPSDIDLIDLWFHSPHVIEFWGDAPTNIDDFRSTMSGNTDLFNYWIGYVDDTPFCLLITTDAARGMPEHLVPFLPETGDAWTLDVLIGPPEFLGRGIAANMLKGFLCHMQRLNGALQTVLIDPAADNSRAIHVYGKVGFQKISEFIPSGGRFQWSHVLMAYHFNN